MKPTGLTLDAGALIAVDKGSELIQTLLREADLHGLPIVVPAAALAQVWRDGSKQVRLARFLKIGANGDPGAPTVEPLHERMARRAGALCGVTGTADVVDASVVLVAKRHGHAVVTSDPGDLAKLDPTLHLIAI
jgi:predicted nucleic acid-binding protein